MKLLQWIPTAALALAGLQLSAQNNPTPESIDRFSYSYGVLLGKSFDMAGLSWEDFNKEDFLAGIKAALEGKNLLIDQQTAQNEVSARMNKAGQEKSRRMAEKEKAFFEENGKKKGMITTPGGLQYEVIKQGTGAKPTAANRVNAHYHGTLLDGTVFDSSVERGQPFTFQLSQVIQGWQEIIQMMPVGSKWRVYIPFEKAYGSRGTGKIPAYSTLIFEIELLGIEQ